MANDGLHVAQGLRERYFEIRRDYLEKTPPKPSKLLYLDRVHLLPTAMLGSSVREMHLLGGNYNTTNRKDIGELTKGAYRDSMEKLGVGYTGVGYTPQKEVGGYSEIKYNPVFNPKDFYGSGNQYIH